MEAKLRFGCDRETNDFFVFIYRDDGIVLSHKEIVGALKDVISHFYVVGEKTNSENRDVFLKTSGPHNYTKERG